jgi:hypothetical protein
VGGLGAAIPELEESKADGGSGAIAHADADSRDESAVGSQGSVMNNL